jgi:hypothetical protein
MPVLAPNETNGRIVTDRYVRGEVFRSMPKTRLIEPARFSDVLDQMISITAGDAVRFAYLPF